jgi:hypothetical protein
MIEVNLYLNQAIAERQASTLQNIRQSSTGINFLASG